MVLLQDGTGLLQIVVLSSRHFFGTVRSLGAGPGKAGNGLQIVAHHIVFGGACLHQLEFLQLVLHRLLDFPLKGKGIQFFLQLLVVGVVGVGGDTQLLLDGLQLLLQEVFPLLGFDAVVDLRLDLLLNPQQLLLLLDEHQHLLHPLPHVECLQHLLLLVAVNVQDGGDEVCNLPRMVDVHHVQPHFLGEQGIVVGNLLHLADEGTGEGLHLKGVVLLVLQILHHRHHGLPLAQHLPDAEALDGGDEDVHAAVGQVYLLDDAGNSTHLMQVVGCGILGVLLQHHNTDKAVPGIGILRHPGIVAGGNHQRGEDAGENGTAGNRNQIELVGKGLLHRHNGGLLGRASLAGSVILGSGSLL